MIIRFFKDSRPLLYIVIPLLVLGIWLPSFTSGHYTLLPNCNNSGFLLNGLLDFLGQRPVLSKVSALLISMCTAFLLVWLNARFFFISYRSLMPALVYLLLSVSLVPLKAFHPVLIAVLILLWVINKLFSTYKYDGLAFHFFDAGLLLAVAGFFYFPSMFFIVCLWTALLIFRPYRWREWLFSVTGLILPYLFYGTWLYYNSGRVGELFIRIGEEFSLPAVQVEFNTELKFYLLFILLLVLLSSVFMMRGFDTKKIQVRKFFLFFLYLFGVSILVYLSIPWAGYEMIYIISIPLSYLISHYFIFARPSRFNNLLFLIFLLAVIVHTYFRILSDQLL